MSGASPSDSATPFRFTGHGSHYFRIWIVNLIFTILTLGIYSAWAKVRTRRYFLANTWFGGSFDYHATPKMVLKDRSIVLGVALSCVVAAGLQPGIAGALLLLFLVAAPWLLWRSLRFDLAMTSYRNVRFGFDGTLKEAYVVFLLLPALPLLPLLPPALADGLGNGEAGGVSLGLSLALALLVALMVAPWAHRRLLTYVLGNLRYGQGRFTVELSNRRFYAIYLACVAWLLLVVVVGGGLATLFEHSLGAEERTTFAPRADSSAGRGAVSDYLPLLLLIIWARAWLEARVRNYAFSHMHLDDKLHMASSLSISRLFWIHLSNLLMLVCSLGLAWPWARVRLTRYKTEAAAAELRSDLHAYVSQQQEATSSLLREDSELFDAAPEPGF